MVAEDVLVDVFHDKLRLALGDTELLGTHLSYAFGDLGVQPLEQHLEVLDRDSLAVELAAGLTHFV